MAPTPPAAAAVRKLAGYGIQVVVDGRDGGQNDRRLRPLVRIETMQPVRQSVPFFGGPGPAQDALLQIVIALAQPGGVTRPNRPAEQRLVFDDHLHGLGRRRARPLLVGPRARALALVRPLARLRAWQRRFAHQALPVEGQIGMRVLERFHHFVFKRAPAHLAAGGRSEEIEHARTRGAVGAPIGMHDERGFVAPLVPRISDERHGPISSCPSSPCPRVSLLSGLSRPWAWPPPSWRARAWPPSSAAWVLDASTPPRVSW